MEADDLAAPLAPELKKPSAKSESILENCAYLSVILVAYVGLITITLILSVEAARNAFHPSKGSIIVAGAIHDTTKMDALTDHVSPWDRVCSNFGGAGLLSKHQSRQLYAIRTLIRQHSAPHSALLDMCLKPPQSKLVLLNAAERWSRGFSVQGLTIGAAPGAYTLNHGTRIYISSALPTHGAAVFEPPKPIQNCPAADQALAALNIPETTVAYADNPKSVCEQLGRVNLTAPPTQITIDVSKKSCSHLIAKAYSNIYANLYLQNLKDPRLGEIQLMFDQLKSAAFSMLGHFGERFRKKIDALRLLPAIYHDAPSLETDSLKDLNFTAWLLDAKKKEWLSGWDPESTLPLMQPWAVNAYYDPTQNIVFIPPGLMNISPPDTAPALVWATVGFILSHEISHATDPSGIHFNEDGIYNPIKLPPEYNSFVTCLRNNAASEGIHVDQTLGENYADTVGWAILESMSDIFDDSTELRILGLGSGREAAQLAFARMWCSNPDHVSADERNKTIFYDPHPPPDFRVNTALRWRSYKACVIK